MFSSSSSSLYNVSVWWRRLTSESKKPISSSRKFLLLFALEMRGYSEMLV
jgi:hypothetical protein